MIRIIQSEDFDPALLRRNNCEQQEIEGQVRTILSDVKQRGDEALRYYTQRFDSVSISDLRVTDSQLKQALDSMDPAFIRVLYQAADNIRAFHNLQLRTGFSVRPQDGVLMGQRITPIERVGIYVPGGTAAYPSTVLMTAIPALIAGVKRVIISTPPKQDGTANASILAAAQIAGVSEIYHVGGAQAIGAMAYGTSSVPSVDKVIGPGNIYVATAKKMVYGLVDIDMIAGPSDILILADDTADPVFVAADMLGQAEHDPLARAVLITTSRKLAVAVSDELDKQCRDLKRSAIAQKSIAQYGAIIICDTMEQAVTLSDCIAPEHLEICTENSDEILERVCNAGSIFLGNYTPEALGDYLAGPNHTLPTDGTSRFFSPLSVDDFIKKSSFLSYSKQALEKVADPVMRFAREEQLEAHARSIAVRLEKQ